MELPFKVESYATQQGRLPSEGRVILGNQDDKSIVVYQAYHPTIGEHAAKYGKFGGQFKMDRMTWIKTNFLWMMYRSEWGKKQGQEIVLAIRLKKSFFNKVLSKCVAALYEESAYSNEAEWIIALSESPVRLQWDPDRDPLGSAIGRRAIQLGLKGDIVKEYVEEGVIEISDISEYVSFQRRRAITGDFRKVNMPNETVYCPDNESLISKLGIARV